MFDPRELAAALALALRRGEWAAARLTERAHQRFRAKWRWLKGVCERAAAAFPQRPNHQTLVAHLAADEGLQAACERKPLTLWRALRREPPARPPKWLDGKSLRAIPTLAELGRWLGLTPGRLSWFAEQRDVPRPAALEHYRHRFLAKRGGGWRLLEAPKDRLKALQREVLVGILDAVPCHEAAHAYLPGRSHFTAVAPHIAHAVVVRIDLADFFASIRAARVQAIFRELGYRRSVAAVLARLCTHRTPKSVLSDERFTPAAARLLSTRHLPQGAPTSPALANLCAYRLDARLSALATAAGARYTRYADDLLFSGDESLALSARRFAAAVAGIAMDEGFQVAHRKTRIMRRSVRQHAVGLVINEAANIDRREFDRLKATLTNCARHGPQSQNRDHAPNYRDHLRSRIAYVAATNAARGAKLLAIWERIEWQ
jgi:hypothetical protein